VIFFAILGCDAHLETDQENLHTKLNWCCGMSHEHYLRFLVYSIRSFIL